MKDESFLDGLWNLNLMFMDFKDVYGQIVEAFGYLGYIVGLILAPYCFIKHLFLQIIISPFMGMQYICRKIS